MANKNSGGLVALTVAGTGRVLALRAAGDPCLLVGRGRGARAPHRGPSELKPSPVQISRAEDVPLLILQPPTGAIVTPWQRRTNVWRRGTNPLLATPRGVSGDRSAPSANMDGLVC
jgi:hypothetical protein